MNATFAEIKAIFDEADVLDFIKLPDDFTARAAFAKCFNQFNDILEAAKIQGFTWENLEYEFDGKPKKRIVLAINHHQYLTLVQRYKELSGQSSGGGDSLPFEIDSYLTEIDTGKIDADYMNSHFQKFLKVLQGNDEQAKTNTLTELHRSFTSLSQEDQKIADIFLRDIQRGDIQIVADRTFHDYLNDYKTTVRNQKIEHMVSILGLDKTKLIVMMDSTLTEVNLNEYGRFDDLKNTVDKELAKAYFDRQEGKPLPRSRINIRVATLLKEFLLEGDSDG